MTTLQSLRPGDETVASAIHALLPLAHAQEAQRLRLDADQRPPRSVAGIGRSDEHFIGAYDGADLPGAIGIAADDEPGQLCIWLLVVHPRAQRHQRALVRMAPLLDGDAGVSFSAIHATMDAQHMAELRKVLNRVPSDEAARAAVVESARINCHHFTRIVEAV
jgi:hypothetical protein